MSSVASGGTFAVRLRPVDDPWVRHRSSIARTILPTAPQVLTRNCPYREKCRYGSKCRYNHPERCQPAGPCCSACGHPQRTNSDKRGRAMSGKEIGTRLSLPYNWNNTRVTHSLRPVQSTSSIQTPDNSHLLAFAIGLFHEYKCDHKSSPKEAATDLTARTDSATVPSSTDCQIWKKPNSPGEPKSSSTEAEKHDKRGMAAKTGSTTVFSSAGFQQPPQAPPDDHKDHQHRRLLVEGSALRTTSMVLPDQRDLGSLGNMTTSLADLSNGRTTAGVESSYLASNDGGGKRGRLIRKQNTECADRNTDHGVLLSRALETRPQCSLQYELMQVKQMAQRLTDLDRSGTVSESRENMTPSRCRFPLPVTQAFSWYSSTNFEQCHSAASSAS